MVRNILPFDQCHPMLELKRKRAHRCATVFLMLNLTCNAIANLQYLIYSLWLIVKHIRLLVFMLVENDLHLCNIWKQMRALWYGISSRYIIAVQKFEDFISSWVWGLTLLLLQIMKGMYAAQSALLKMGMIYDLEDQISKLHNCFRRYHKHQDFKKPLIWYNTNFQY